MSRNFLFSRLRRLAQQSLSNETDIERRKFIQAATIGVATLAAAPLLGCTSAKKAVPSFSASIAIIGAGLAGTTCAYSLAKHGIRADLYEAATRVGGRTFSLRNHFADGQTAELGGELIDSNHLAVFQTAQELGLAIDDCRKGAEDPDHFIVNGLILSEAWILENFKPLAKKILAERELADKDPNYFDQLDRLNISEWLDAQLDVALELKQLLKTAYTGEFGLEADQQSAISLIYFIDPESKKEFRIFGDSDERFHIRNGNDQMAQKMSERLLAEPKLDHRLIALRQTTFGYQLTFQYGSAIVDKNYDLVVLAIPFTLLRKIDLSQAGIAPDKIQHIKNLGYGTNAKIMAGFSSRPWYRYTDNFSLIADDPVQTVWETSRGQPGDSGILTNFLGGMRGLLCGAGTPQDQFQPSLSHLEKLYSGLSANLITEKTVRMHWPSQKYAMGSYACYRPGQAGKAGLEGRREGNIFFCGEHCSEDFQGFMEGAIQSGQKAASQILG